MSSSLASWRQDSSSDPGQLSSLLGSAAPLCLHVAVTQVPLLSQGGNKSPSFQVLKLPWQGWAGRQWPFRLPKAASAAGLPWDGPGGSSTGGGGRTGLGGCAQGTPGEQATQLCALCRCHSPLLLEHQGAGPLECEGAREREDGLDGSRHLGNETRGSAAAQPFCPAPSFLPFVLHSCARPIGQHHPATMPVQFVGDVVVGHGTGGTDGNGT